MNRDREQSAPSFLEITDNHIDNLLLSDQHLLLLSRSTGVALPLPLSANAPYPSLNTAIVALDDCSVDRALRKQLSLLRKCLGMYVVHPQGRRRRRRRMQDQTVKHPSPNYSRLYTSTG